MNPGGWAPAILGALAVAVVLAPSAGSGLPRGLAPVNESGGAGSGHGGAPGAGWSARPGSEATETRPGGLVTGLASVAAGVVVALLIGSWFGLALGGATVPVAWRWLARLEPASARRRREALDRDLPLLVDLLAACLRAGQAPGSALAAVTAALEPGPLRAETSRVVARLRLGGDPLATWRAWGRHPQLGALGRTVARALDGGASVADAMGDLARELRRTRRADVQARARSVGARAAAPLGLCLLPAFVLVGVVPVVAGSLTALLQP